MTSADDRDEMWARRAGSFGSHARAYAEHRPDYPAAAVRWALEPLGGSSLGRSSLEVLDLAAGTGKLTAVLVAEGHQVTAVEPDEKMLAELVRRNKEVRALPGSAERVPLPDRSVDAVLVGQAFHWFDRDAALPEIARVLRPGGVLAGLWNYGDLSVPWVAEFDRIGHDGTNRGVSDVDQVMPDHELFTGSARATFPHVHRRTAETLVATVGTQSHVLVAAEEERRALREQVLAFLRARPETAEGEFDFPLTTHVKRMTRA
ncbi:SAM-dependent methyltransferase [Saccharothrix coeruleofusca]|uniref:class I SAM-dependent methyltransferase n=1 Tax=Saccharothrix coeruleofusca TaxID=33919 RepID=UPI001AEA8645|nr:class I SAM-dependent methyltransferase [Saccharothrix coeruleofusca]MBP2340374.1 SAM-dependent methyltransferase [Saccharothrix coeruleofusca]